MVGEPVAPHVGLALEQAVGRVGQLERADQRPYHLAGHEASLKLLLLVLIIYCTGWWQTYEAAIIHFKRLQILKWSKAYLRFPIAN